MAPERSETTINSLARASEFIGRSWMKTSVSKGLLPGGDRTKAKGRLRNGLPRGPARVKPAFQGEKRYWLHPAFVPQSRDYEEAGIAIDRFGGTIAGQQLEEVTE